jgi:hypothetical protein
MQLQRGFLGAVVVWSAFLMAARLDAQGSFHWPEGKRAAISLSFDDARQSQVDVGLPVLDRYGVKATFYVVPGAVSSRLDGWKKAAANGHEIANHSRSHPCTGNYAFSLKNALEDYTLDRMAKELDGANADIERLLGVKPEGFAYPRGEKFVGRGKEVKSYVPLAASRFLVSRGYLDESANDPQVCDLAQAMGVGLDELNGKTVTEWMVRTAKEGRWLIFVSHEVGASAHQTTEPSTLETIIKFAQDPANGVWIGPVATIGRYVQKQRSGR